MRRQVRIISEGALAVLLAGMLVAFVVGYASTADAGEPCGTDELCNSVPAGCSGFCATTTCASPDCPNGTGGGPEDECKYCVIEP